MFDLLCNPQSRIVYMGETKFWHFAEFLITLQFSSQWVMEF